MKMNNKNIDDLFNLAKNEEPIISGDDVRNLIENSTNYNVKFKYFKTIGGISPMYFIISTISAVAAVGIIGFNVLTNDNQNSNPALTQQYQLSSGDLSMNAGTEENSVITESTSDKPVNINLEDNKVNKQIKNLETLDIRGIKSIKITPEEAINLGIIINDVYKSPNIQFNSTINDEEVEVNIFSKGGVTTKSLNKDSKNIFIHPKLVTSISGMKRAAWLDDKDDYIFQSQSKVMDGNKVFKFVHVKNKNKNNNPDYQIDVTVVQSDSNVTYMQQENNNPDLDMDFSLPYMDNNKTPIESDEQEIETVNRNLLFDIENLPDDETELQDIVIDLNMCDSSLKKIDWKSFNISIDSTLDASMMILDSSLCRMNLDLSRMMKNNKVNVDSIIHHSMKNLSSGKLRTIIKIDSLKKYLNFFENDSMIRHFGNKNNLMRQDTLIKNADKNININKKIIIKSVDVNKDSKQPSGNGLWVMNTDKKIKVDAASDNQLKINGLMDMSDKLKTAGDELINKIYINKMIAIEVPMKNNGGFIFWFEPSSDIVDKLPERIKSSLGKELTALNNNQTTSCNEMPKTGDDVYMDVWRACSGAIENLSVFPNPVDDMINLKMNITADRNLVFNLHDVTGKKIRNFSGFSRYQPGTLELSFNIKDIQPGIYLIVVQSDKSEQAVQRVVVE